MMKQIARISAALAAAAGLCIPGPAAASSHREAPAITEDPAADNTDLYAFVAGTNLIIIANYLPLEEPAGGPNFHTFSDDVLYEVHIVRGADSLEDELTYQIRFQTKPFPKHDPAALDESPAGGNEFFSQIAVDPADFAGGAQTYSVTKIDKNGAAVIADGIPVVPPNIGPRTNQSVYKIPAGKTYEDFAMDPKFKKSMGAEGSVWAGPRDDGFYADLGAIFDLAGLQTILNERPPRDDVAGHNVHTIALQIPLNIANGGAAVVSGAASDEQTIGVWASASRRKVSILRRRDAADRMGPWVQVSRLGLPLLNEVVIGLQDKDKYNRTHPKDDKVNFSAYFLNPIIVRDAKYAGFYDVGGPLPGVSFEEMRSNRSDIIDFINLKDSGHNITSVGDVLRVDLGLASSFPNGRKINAGSDTEEDVTDIALSLLLTRFKLPVKDGVDKNDKTFRDDFPYLASPWDGAMKK